MIHEHEESAAIERQDSKSEGLSFRIDLWREDKGAVERVLARASSASLAQAIFAAARREYLGRYLTLSDGQRTILTSD